MKVQVLETCDCSCQVSPNSCHFWNKRSVFLQILYQSPGSWHITPLYFLAKTLHILRSLSKYKFGEILCEQSKVWNFAFWWAPLVQIMYIFSQKITEELSLMTLNSDPKLKKNSLFIWKMTWKIWWILTWAVKNLKICTLMGCFCQKHVAFELK